MSTRNAIIITRIVQGGTALDKHRKPDRIIVLMFCLTGVRTIFLKEVSVLRATEPSAEKVNAIPDDALEALVRCLYPAMIAFFESDEGQREFAEWQSLRGIENLPGREVKPDENVRLAG
jgi:hypothetical protein